MGGLIEFVTHFLHIWMIQSHNMTKIWLPKGEKWPAALGGERCDKGVAFQTQACTQPKNWPLILKRMDLPEW